jgi:hypothetical protein
MIQSIFGSPVIILKVNNVEDIFSKKVYQKVSNYLMKRKNKFVNHPHAKGGQLCTTDLSGNMSIDVINEITTLIDFLKITTLNYTHLFVDKPVKNLEFSYYWVNLMFQGCMIKNHIDRAKDTETRLITTFYPKAPPGGANLVFIHNSVGGEWPNECSKKNLVKIHIEEGNIVIFDTDTLHAVDTHAVDSSRMCIAVEFRIET